MVKSRKLRAAVTTLGVVLATLAVQLAFPSAAQARCNGEDNAVTSKLIWGGEVIVSERPLAGTCNDNKTYQGRYRNETGWFASVWIQNGGVWTVWAETRTTSEWKDYRYSDTNSHSYISLCASNVSPFSNARGIHRCGWGSSVTSYINYTFAGLPNPTNYGINHGF